MGSYIFYQNIKSLTNEFIVASDSVNICEDSSQYLVIKFRNKEYSFQSPSKDCIKNKLNNARFIVGIDSIRFEQRSDFPDIYGSTINIHAEVSYTILDASQGQLVAAGRTKYACSPAPPFYISTKSSWTPAMKQSAIDVWKTAPFEKPFTIPAKTR